jgi:hypothetical protein
MLWHTRLACANFVVFRPTPIAIVGIKLKREKRFYSGLTVHLPVPLL